MYAHDLQTIDHNFLVLQHTHAGISNCIQIGRAVPELFVIARDEICTPGSRTIFPGLGKNGSVNFGPVVQVARDENDVRLEACKLGDDAPHESESIHVAEVNVGNQHCHTTTPGCRQVGEIDRDPLDPHPTRIQDSVQAGEHGEPQHCSRPGRTVDLEPTQPCSKINHPTQTRCHEEKVHCAQPGG